VILGEYLAGSIVVLMLAGGEALENYALRTASSVLEALARRVPSAAHRKRDGVFEDVALDTIAVDDLVLVHPHEICPVDGEVIEGHGKMDEAYLTGEPFEITKTRGSAVISGAINGDAALLVRATARAVDSRYAKIASVMRESADSRPQLRRLGDQLGAIYTPGRSRHRPPRVGGDGQRHSFSGGAGYRDAVPSAHRNSCGHHSARFHSVRANRSSSAARWRSNG
jgi:cation transport ATPase